MSLHRSTGLKRTLLSDAHSLYFPRMVLCLQTGVFFFFFNGQLFLSAGPAISDKM